MSGPNALSVASTTSAVPGGPMIGSGGGSGVNVVTQRVISTSPRSATWSLWRCVRSSAVRALAPTPTAVARCRTPRPQSTSSVWPPARSSVEGPARSGSGMGLPVPSRMTSIMSSGMSQQRSEVEAFAFTRRQLVLAWCEAGHKGVEASMRIADVLRNKGAAVATISPDTRVTELLAGMAQHNIGAMVVMGPDGLVGIVSERDVVRRLNERGADLLQMPVSEIMTSVVVTCAPGDAIDTLSGLMTENRVRHVPVIADGQLAGIVSSGDVVKTRMEELKAEQEQLQTYIPQGGRSTSVPVGKPMSASCP